MLVVKFQAFQKKESELDRYLKNLYVFSKNRKVITS